MTDDVADKPESL